ncbi:MAG: hypothetical protein RLZZ455_685 [Candidatus Parcubacteria bacterium]|jgi:hypothetical protein
MEANDAPLSSPDSQRVLPYTLSIDDFKTSPIQIIPNPTLEKVTRDNFVPTMISTFAYSRGNVAAQLIELDWMKQAHGFNFETTISNFLGAGGVNVLSEIETKRIVDSYRRVRSHERYLTREGYQTKTDAEVLENFQNSLSEFGPEKIARTREDCEERLEKYYGNLANLDKLPFEIFMKILHADILKD